MRARSLHYLGATLLAAATLFGASAWGVEFTHDRHNKTVEIADCGVCHKGGALSIVPDRKVCLECHKEEQLKDYSFGKLKTHGPFWVDEHNRDARESDARCAKCHEQKFCLQCHKGDPKIDRPKSHLAGYLELHPIKARGNTNYCAKCHETNFCSDCHNRFRGEDLKVLSHRKGWSSLPAGGVNHERFQSDPNSCAQCHPGGVLTTHQWTDDHAREARRNLATCQSCHPEGDVCKKCHSAVKGLKANPHPKNWDSKHERIAKASDERSCRACHLSKSQDPTCRKCH